MMQNCSSTEEVKHDVEIDPSVISVAVKKSIEYYLSLLDDEEPYDLYSLYVAEAEKGLIESVFNYANKKVSKTSRILGLSKERTIKKLDKYNVR